MNALIQLSDRIAQYNLIGKIKLPIIKLAIIQTRVHQDQVLHIIKKLSCYQVHSFAEMMGIGGCKCFRSEKIKNFQLFLMDSIYGEEAIEDRQFHKRRKIFQSFRTNKQVFLLHMDLKSYKLSQIDSRQQLMNLKRVETYVVKDIEWKGNISSLCRDVVKVWESGNKYNIINCLKDIKALVKEYQKEEKRQEQWLRMLTGETDPLTYALRLNYASKSFLVNSFQGYYTPEVTSLPMKYSIHWQIMDILQDLWKEEGRILIQDLEGMPLTYIEQMLRMNDFNTIGGFLPESCFLKIFKPLLERFAEATIMCLEAAKYKIMQNVQMVYEHFYSKTNIKQPLIDLEIGQIQTICDRFLQEVSNAIHSQISYVYAPAESFWGMRNIRSQLYSTEQQANIQIKYIGRIYVRKVYESIRQSVPRYLGQGLLRKISRHINENSMQNLLFVIGQTPIAVTLTGQQQEQIQSKQVKKKQCQQLIHFFSLKVNSTYLLKNLTLNIEKRYKQSFCYQQQHYTEKDPKMNPKEQEKGFFHWMKRLFANPQEPKRPKRAQSIQKSVQIQSKIQTKKESLETEQDCFQPSITDKAWILILHNNKKISESKLLTASSEGFSEKLRPSIWYWLAIRDHQNYQQNKLAPTLESAAVDQDIARQIQKDLSRTPPTLLFRKKYRSSLRRVLQGYSLIDCEIGYTQGMNFIAAVILCTLIHYGIKDDYLRESSQNRNVKDLQQKSFVIFRYMMEKTGFRKMMRIQHGHIAEICIKIEERITQLNRKVSEIINSSGFTCEILFGPLLISGLLTWSNNLEIKQRIADTILLRGIQTLYNVVAGVAAMSEPELSRLRNEEIYDFLRNKALDSFFDKVGSKGLTELFNSF